MAREDIWRRMRENVSWIEDLVLRPDSTTLANHSLR